MNKPIQSMFVCVLLLFAMGASFAVADGPVEAPPACQHCRMDRTMFNFSRMLVTYTDNSTAGTCSLNCVITENMKVKGKKIKSVKVADYISKELIDVKTAIWVVGGSKRAVMSANAKWAFAEKIAAEAFISQYGGYLATYKEVYDMAKNEPQHSH
jgi:copper chaperone NosL